MTSRISDTEAAHALLSAHTVRTRARMLYDTATADQLADWTLDLSRLSPCADFVAEIVRERYPDLDVPFHARWRHFVFNRRDLWSEIADTANWRDGDVRARAEFDLIITSVLLDAGAGAAWRFRDDASQLTAVRSEGLALASLRLFEWGAFSGDPADPLRADAAALARLDAAALGDAFQVTPRNPLIGLDGRAALLNRLARATQARPDLFALADTPRPGGLYDLLTSRADKHALPAPVILEAVLEALGPIWQNRPSLGGVPLGDCWPHPALPGDGFAPLHKLSQWLTYSLIEPLERAGIRVTEIEGLTGLAEYRNGGLFVDCGVLAPRARSMFDRTHNVSDPFVVGWRALTLALLDDIAPMVRERLGASVAMFPLARVLEGGTWAAGRRIAQEKRSDARAPFTIISDGTVF